MLPRFSIALRCRTSTPWRAISWAPRARLMLRIAERSSGLRPTASAIENRSVSSAGRPSATLTTSTASTMTSSFEHDAVGRDQAARGQQDDVARHHLRHGDRCRFSVAEHGSLRSHTRLQLLHDALRLEFARVADTDARDHDDDDQGRVYPFSGQRRRRRGEEQQQEQRAVRLIHEHGRAGHASLLAELVRAVLLQSFGGVVGFQAGRRTLQVSEQIRRGKRPILVELVRRRLLHGCRRRCSRSSARSFTPSSMRRSIAKPTGSSTAGPKAKRVARSPEHAAR